MDDGGLTRLAERVGVSDRHLRRVFDASSACRRSSTRRRTGCCSPSACSPTPGLPVTDIALASGFASVRRFNALFRDRYRMAPSRLRRESTPDARADGLVFDLAYRPPYDFDAMLAFLRARAVDGIEVADDARYVRSIAIRRGDAWHAGHVEVRQLVRKHALRVTVSPSLARVVPAVLGRARHAFDLAADPRDIGTRSARSRVRVPDCDCRARSTASSSRCARSSGSRSR
jgi:AraC family transcriptional regulator of adaptative response / DNA-3-methyladenine glycosylase II